MGSKERDFYGNRQEEILSNWFVGMEKIYRDKTETTLKEILLVAYSIEAFLLKWSVPQWQYLLDNGYKLIGFRTVESYGNIQDERGVHDVE